MDIFQFVKDKKNINEKEREKLRFSSWRKNFNFNLMQETSVLNISYKSKDKYLILPVLNKISKVYQDYSGQKKLKKINSALDYYENQLVIYKEKYDKSMKDAQNFALKYDFPVSQILPNDAKVDNSYNSFEKEFDSINSLKIINKQLEEIKNNELNSNQIIFLAESAGSDNKFNSAELLKN